jgi:propanol-preferring alcohol dehydrogenase
MFAMVLNRIGAPLEWTERPDPLPGPGEIRLQISACGVCRTDLHVVDGELPNPRTPIIPGHEIVGKVDRLGPGVSGFSLGERVGVPWLGHTCQACQPCAGGHENLCDAPQFTGFSRDGGYAQMTVADARFAFPLGDAGDDASLAPLLCAGLIGWRSLKIAGRSAGRIEKLGLYGFGAAAHIIAQVAIKQGHEVFAFARPGDEASQDFARKLGACWAGGSDEPAPEKLDAAIIFAPVGALVPIALKAVRKGGAVVCAGIHMSDIPGFPYALLWEANAALADLRAGAFDGAAVLIP